MANNTIWIEKFKIPSDLKLEFDRSSSSDKSFLVWCLENGHVDEREYLNWASQEFKLPIVSSEFFADEEAKKNWRATWVTARTLHTWNASLLPLHESSGVVRVGCLEVPELNLNQPVAYVLAPLSGMKAFWTEAFGKPVQEPVEQKQEITKPEIIVLAASSPPPAPQEAEVPAFADVPPPPPQEFDANSLMANWGTPEEPTEEVSVDAKATPQEESQMPDGFAMPEGFSASAPSTESVANIPVPQVDIPMPSIVKIAAAPAEAPVESPVEIPVEPQAAAPIVAEQTVPHVPPPPPPAPAQPEFVAAKAKPPIPPMAPAAPGKPVGDFIGMIDFRNPKDKYDDCHDLSDVVTVAFAKFARYFDRHMLLLMKGFELRPHVWAGNWNLRSARPAGINLEQPSIFRIVSRTKLPYHGYTKPSLANDIFFAEWCNNTPPAHVTAVPLLVNGQLVGIILGATDGSLDQKVVLNEAVRWAEGLAPHVARTKSVVAKAA